MLKEHNRDMDISRSPYGNKAERGRGEKLVNVSHPINSCTHILCSQLCWAPPIIISWLLDAQLHCLFFYPVFISSYNVDGSNKPLCDYYYLPFVLISDNKVTPLKK
ncbi:hypothetical protein AMECASPLE_035824 [Ameca splendens]|uniref:Uncharacterized protein n=1 Tax=Ameca splendens TaxID=208324 RepID=A0ABV0YIW1_9TELE